MKNILIFGAQFDLTGKVVKNLVSKGYSVDLICDLKEDFPVHSLYSYSEITELLLQSLITSVDACIYLIQSRDESIKHALSIQLSQRKRALIYSSMGFDNIHSLVEFKKEITTDFDDIRIASVTRSLELREAFMFQNMLRAAKQNKEIIVDVNDHAIDITSDSDVAEMLVRLLTYEDIPTEPVYNLHQRMIYPIELAKQIIDMTKSSSPIIRKYEKQSKSKMSPIINEHLNFMIEDMRTVEEIIKENI